MTALCTATAQTSRRLSPAALKAMSMSLVAVALVFAALWAWLALAEEFGSPLIAAILVDMIGLALVPVFGGLFRSGTRRLPHHSR